VSHNVLGPMFHGTSETAADGILKDGARPSWTGALGPGFYFSPEEEVADHYAREKGEEDAPAILRGEVEVENPAHFANADELWQKSNEIGYATPAEYTSHLFRKGHDAVIAGRVGILAKHGAFRPQALRAKAGEPWTDLT